MTINKLVEESRQRLLMIRVRVPQLREALARLEQEEIKLKELISQLEEVK